jgi:hypothetical protein
MRNLALSALCTLLLSASLPLSADARPQARPELRPSNMALSMPSIAQLSQGPVQLIDSKGKYAASYRLNATLNQVGAKLRLLFQTRQVMPDGSRILGYTETSWGEIHALVGNGKTGQVVHFIPSGHQTVAKVHTDVLNPTKVASSRR